MFNRKEYMKEYRLKNKEKLKEAKKKYRLENLERERQRSRDYHLNNKEKEREAHIKWEEKNKEKRKAQRKKRTLKDKISGKSKIVNRMYYLKNRENLKNRSIEWFELHPNYKKKYYQNNKEKINKYKRRKWEEDIKYNINGKIRNQMNSSLRRNKQGKHWENLVDYKLDDLIKHLKKTIPHGYTWQDIFNGKLHIDHIIPISVFNFDSPEQIDFQRCWNLNNLQLLPSSENCRKQAKIDNPFQPALKITRNE
jgi:hypothetical protein